MSKCLGCGISLQNNSQNLPGYVKDLTFKYCERCFRNVHYSEIKEENLSISNEDIIKEINTSADLTFFITDLLNISTDVINLFKLINSKKYLVINKMDIIPKDLKQNKIMSFLNDNYQIKDKIIFTSIKNNNLIDYFANYKNIYFCGLSNSGKSSLVSHISGNKNITSSNMINTTLDYLKIKYQNYNLIDCPGFIINHNNIDHKYLKLIIPSKMLKIRNYQVKDNTTLNIHNIFKIGFVNHNKVTCYISNGLVITKEYQNEEVNEIKVSSNCDLVILGIGFLNIKESGIIKIPKNIKYEIRKSIFQE